MAGASGVLAGTTSTASSPLRRPLPLQADGEDLGDVREAVFEAERDAVTVLVWSGPGSGPDSKSI